MVELLRRIANSPTFQNTITAVILFAAILVGIETYESLATAYATEIHFLDKIILAIFVGEIVVKMGAEYPNILRYFRDSWNVFDFVIVAACFIPGMAQYAVVLRLLRLLRVLKLVRALPKLQILVSALLKSIPSMVYVALLLGMLFYVYACAAVFLFGTNDPLHFANLEYSLLTLFRVVTLEDWTDIMYIQMFGCAEYPLEMHQNLCVNPEPSPLLGAGFFISFVLLGTMIILNLFIGVIMNGMDEARKEGEEYNEAQKFAKALAAKDVTELDVELSEIAGELVAIQEKLHFFHKRARRTLARTSQANPRTRNRPTLDETHDWARDGDGPESRE